VGKGSKGKKSDNTQYWEREGNRERPFGQLRVSISKKKKTPAPRKKEGHCCRYELREEKTRSKGVERSFNQRAGGRKIHVKKKKLLHLVK